MSIEDPNSIYSPEGEALNVLGLEKGATPDEIIDRYIQLFNQNRNSTEELTRFKDAMRNLEDIYFPSDPRLKEINMRVDETLTRIEKRNNESLGRIDKNVKESQGRIDRRVEESKKRLG